MENLQNFAHGDWYVLDAGSIDKISAVLDRYGNEAQKAINDVIHGEGAALIRRNIARILPASGRTWKKKGMAARAAMPGAFEQDNDLLAVTIAAMGRYHYLYFPDDGSNTKNHVGNQGFMRRGAEAAVDKIIDICLGRLGEAFGG